VTDDLAMEAEQQLMGAESWVLDLSWNQIGFEAGEHVCDASCGWDAPCGGLWQTAALVAACRWCQCV
jgi:hypothetical protein